VSTVTVTVDTRQITVFFVVFTTSNKPHQATAMAGE
jgi:ribosome-binding factor A